MNTFTRWGKFNLVGAMGMVVQLAALPLFNRWAGGRYLWATAAAIELTLMHNFIWHLRYTWRDRGGADTRLRQLVRFHFSNGLVSMLGNLALMRLLVHEARLPLLVSIVIAILCCSMMNFSLGNNWAFAVSPKAEDHITACKPNRGESALADPVSCDGHQALADDPWTLLAAARIFPTAADTLARFDPSEPLRSDCNFRSRSSVSRFPVLF